ncbi:molybdopterin-dependent oxidoreductase [Ammoniphilus sp. CFH 90114]|uniref:molybdopterin-containing oxidoreductase family protein n=1 Tax=Ammoniphilus sp. CFH 90114 TaxID=2493665 RepID=UPI00100DA493|nr:molybdopterin oxidoreductase family protein [Ammoniphilus sp. CFH 90114]RXT06343.1 molybdopterin oxidoreductase family protein [Ammoniphilus sp. CFH 90114]
MTRFIEKQEGVFRSVCPLDCPDTCALHVYKENGKIVKVTGNPEHPVTQGAICNKVRNMTERIYHPERLMHPMKRVGKKGEGKFEPISWSEAMEEITQRFKGIIASDGPEAILPYSFYGNMGLLNADGMDRRFFHKLGSSQLDQTICSIAGNVGFGYTMGITGGLQPEETVDSKLIIVWGANLVSTNMHQMILAEKARKNGAKVIVIDVHKNQTGKWADWFIPILPGTDAALALGIMHVLFKEFMVDEAFLAKYTHGYVELREHVKEYTPNKVAQITGVPASDIIELSRLYGTISPTFIRIGNGLQHHDNGGMAVRTIACLPALTGQWAKWGGGATKSNGWYARLNQQALARPNLRTNTNARIINMNQLGSALLDLHDPPIKALFVYGTNPAVVAPDTNQVIQGLLREDLFTVVHDLFLTDTAKYADLVLPATSSFENTDLYKSYWHPYIQLQEPVISPLGESKSNFELFQLLAQAMGYHEEEFKESEEDLVRQALDYPSNPYLSGITLEGLKEKGWMKVNLPDKKPFLQELPTPTGKIELYSSIMENIGLPALPTYIPLIEGYDGERIPSETDSYPLMLITPPNHNFLNSTFSNVQKLQTIEKEPLLQIHPLDASRRGIVDGDLVQVWNGRGECQLTAKVVDHMLPGVVVSQGLWWESPEKSQAVNKLTSSRIADMGGGATFFSTTVEIRKS